MKRRWLLLLFGVAVARTTTPSWAQTAMVTAYTTDHPGKNPPWLGLATQTGRYEVLLGDGGKPISADINVLLNASDESNEAQWTLQPSDSAQACNVAEWHWMGNLPCARNDTGDCDVANA